MKVLYRVDFYHRDECCVELITITSIRNKDKKNHTSFFHQMWHIIGYITQEHQIKYFQVRMSVWNIYSDVL